VQFAHNLEFASESLGFPGFGCVLGPQAFDLLVQLRDAFAKLRPLALASFAPGGEQPFLAGNHGGDFGIGSSAKQFVGKYYGLGAVTLCFKPCPTRGELIDRIGDDLQIGSHLRTVESNEDVTGFCPCAFLDMKLADDAAGRVLDLLRIRFNNQRARRNDGARELRCRGPPADPAEQYENRGNPAGDMAPDGSCSQFPGLHHGHGLTLVKATLLGRLML
jgi:hypothetical protein